MNVTWPKFYARHYWLLMPILLASLFTVSCSSQTPTLPPTLSVSTLRIAVLSPTSGELSTVGRALRNGIQMAIDEWNAQGGVLRHHVEWVLFDTDCTFESGQQATQQAANEGLQFIIGPICSEAAIGSTSVAEPAGVLTIAPAATHPLVTVNAHGQTRPASFRVSYSYRLQGQAAAQFALDTLDIRKAAIFFDTGDDYASSLAETFNQQFSADGGEVVYRAGYTQEMVDVSQLLTDAGEAQAKLIYLPGQATVVNRVAQQLKDTGLNNQIRLLGSDAWDAENLDLNITAGSYFPIHFLATNQQKWVDSYKSTYAIEPHVLAALGYDAANILINAIQQAGTIEPDNVIEKLEGNTFETVTGQISFDQFHNPLKPVHFVQVMENKLVHVQSIYTNEINP